MRRPGAVVAALGAALAAAALTVSPAHAQPTDVAAQIKLVETQPADMDRSTWKERRRDAARKLGQSKDRRAVAAMQIASAPHYPAEPRALVCGEVLAVLARAEVGNGAAVVQRFFDAANAARFNASSTSDDLLAQQSELDAVLRKLGERL